MNTIKNLILVTTIMTLSMSLNAQEKVEVKTSATALTLCKAEAELAHPGYQRSDHKKIKQLRGKFKINLRVKTETGKINTVCEITKDGEITYTKK